MPSAILIFYVVNIWIGRRLFLVTDTNTENIDKSKSYTGLSGWGGWQNTANCSVIHQRNEAKYVYFRTPVQLLSTKKKCMQSWIQSFFRDILFLRIEDTSVIKTPWRTVSIRHCCERVRCTETHSTLSVNKNNDWTCRSRLALETMISVQILKPIYFRADSYE